MSGYKGHPRVCPIPDYDKKAHLLTSMQDPDMAPHIPILVLVATDNVDTAVREAAAVDPRAILTAGGDERYAAEYGVIFTITTPPRRIRSARAAMDMVIQNNGCDAIGEVDLALYNPEPRRSLDELLVGVNVSMGGGWVDGWTCSVATHVAASAALFKRNGVVQEDDWLVVPLVLAPFNCGRLLPLPLALNHSEPFIVQLWLANDDDDDDKYSGREPFRAELWGMRYFLDYNARRIVKNREVKLQLLICQHQHRLTAVKAPAATSATTTTTDVVIPTPELRTFVYPLQLELPVCAIYFWGMDASMTRSVRLRMLGHDGQAWPVALLRRAAERKGVKVKVHDTPVSKDREALFILFGDDDVPRSTLNMSRIDAASLVLESFEPDPPELHIVGVNYNIVTVTQGRGWPRFVLQPEITRSYTPAGTCVLPPDVSPVARVVALWLDSTVRETDDPGHWLAEYALRYSLRERVRFTYRTLDEDTVADAVDVAFGELDRFLAGKTKARVQVPREKGYLCRNSDWAWGYQGLERVDGTWGDHLISDLCAYSDLGGTLDWDRC
jgi:hypothetical protein